MRVLMVQHVPFEVPGLIGEWAQERGHDVSSMLAPTEAYPNPADIDFLVVLGGPMAADDEIGNSWLVAEKRFIASVLAEKCAVLGVCLGAQILAEVLGGKVRRNACREIGWFPVELTDAGRADPLFADWKSPFTVGLWHGDTFDLPAGIESALSSAACRNQAFALGERVVGLQFHIEWTVDALAGLANSCGGEIAESAGEPYVVSAEKLLGELPGHIEAGRTALNTLLDRMAEGLHER